MSTQIVPRCPITIRPATMGDLPFLDSLQKMHTKQVGWMPTKQLEGKIKAGHVLIAENGAPIGYCIGHDQYFKRDDVGIIYQLNVVPGKQRSLIGATLIKAMFDRAAYGCRLFCCWCAQDIEANYFWESIGFIPLAFRAGSRGKGRVHIFWQRRIREGDTTTPYWFPSQTSAGSIREDRLVLPIPPGTHWSDVMPVLLPSTPSEPAALPAPRQRKVRAPVVVKKPTTCHGLRLKSVEEPKPALVKTPKPPRPKVKNDPAHVAAARELRDRWLEQVNAGTLLARGKYEVSRQLDVAPMPRKKVALLEAA